MYIIFLILQLTIEKLMQNINITFAKNEELDNLIDTFKQFIEGFESQRGYAESGFNCKRNRKMRYERNKRHRTHRKIENTY